MLITFANQKGGSQKSTITALFATAAHYGIDSLKVAVIDADLQHSLADLRNAEVENIKNDDYYRLKFEKQQLLVDNKPLYPIIYAYQSEDILREIKRLKAEGYNMILLDLPGSLEKEGLGKVYAELNFIFVPVSSDTNSFNSSNQFIHKINQNFLNNQSFKHNIKAMAVLFTKLTQDERLGMTKRFNEIKAVYGNAGLKILENGFPYTKVYESEIVSTVFPFPKSSEYAKINPYSLIQEIIEFISKHLK